MASIASDMQQILDLALEYSKDHHEPKMRQRAELGADLARRPAACPAVKLTICSRVSAAVA